MNWDDVLLEIVKKRVNFTSKTKTAGFTNCDFGVGNAEWIFILNENRMLFMPKAVAKMA